MLQVVRGRWIVGSVGIAVLILGMLVVSAGPALGQEDGQSCIEPGDGGGDYPPSGGQYDPGELELTGGVLVPGAGASFSFEGAEPGVEYCAQIDAELLVLPEIAASADGSLTWSGLPMLGDLLRAAAAPQAPSSPVSEFELEGRHRVDVYVGDERVQVLAREFCVAGDGEIDVEGTCDADGGVPGDDDPGNDDPGADDPGAGDPGDDGAIGEPAADDRGVSGGRFTDDGASGGTVQAPASPVGVGAGGASTGPLAFTGVDHLGMALRLGALCLAAGIALRYWQRRLMASA